MFEFWFFFRLGNPIHFQIWSMSSNKLSYIVLLYFSVVCKLSRWRHICLPSTRNIHSICTWYRNPHTYYFTIVNIMSWRHRLSKEKNTVKPHLYTTHVYVNESCPLTMDDNYLSVSVKQKQLKKTTIAILLKMSVTSRWSCLYQWSLVVHLNVHKVRKSSVIEEFRGDYERVLSAFILNSTKDLSRFHLTDNQLA